MNLEQPPSRSCATERPTDTAFRALIRTCGLLARVMQPYFARFGISGAQWGILCALHRSEQEGMFGLRLTDLSGRLLVRPPSVTGVVDRLVRMGLVARDPATTDLRVKHVTLTVAGRRLTQRVLKGHEKQISAVLGGLSISEQEQLERLLSRLGSHLETMANEEVDAPAE